MTPIQTAARKVDLTPDEQGRLAQRRENAAKAAYVRTIVDPGVALYVATLIEAGVETYESCQGGPHEDREARGGYDHAYPQPTVRFHGTQGAGWWALQVCLDHDFPVESLSRIWTVEDREPHGPTWQLVFREPAA